MNSAAGVPAQWNPGKSATAPFHPQHRGDAGILRRLHHLHLHLDEGPPPSIVEATAIQEPGEPGESGESGEPRDPGETRDSSDRAQRVQRAQKEQKASTPGLVRAISCAECDEVRFFALLRVLLSNFFLLILGILAIIWMGFYCWISTVHNFSIAVI